MSSRTFKFLCTVLSLPALLITSLSLSAENKITAPHQPYNGRFSLGTHVQYANVMSSTTLIHKSGSSGGFGIGFNFGYDYSFRNIYMGGELRYTFINYVSSSTQKSPLYQHFDVQYSNMIDVVGHFGWGNTEAVFFILGMSSIQEKTKANKSISSKSKTFNFGPRLGLGGKWQFANDWVASCQLAGSLHTLSKDITVDTAKFSTIQFRGYAVALRWDVSMGIAWAF